MNDYCTCGLPVGVIDTEQHTMSCHYRKIVELEAQLAAAHTLIHQIEDEIKFTGSEINVRKSINNYRAAIKGEASK